MCVSGEIQGRKDRPIDFRGGLRTKVEHPESRREEGLLGAYYYLDHFVEMLGFAQRTYGPILTAEHYAFIARFEGLSKDARCLLIRMRRIAGHRRRCCNSWNAAVTRVRRLDLCDELSARLPPSTRLIETDLAPLDG